jgi:AraC-like DNA-binding protein
MTPTVLLPEGIPTYASSHMAGRFTAAPGYLPVTIFFEDWDLYWVRAGKGAFVLGTGHRIDIQPGDFLLLPPLISARVEETRPTLEFNYCHFDFRPLRRAPSEWDGPDCRGPGPLARVPLRFSTTDAPGLLKSYKRLIAVQEAVRKSSLKPGSSGFWQIERAVIDLIDQLALFGLKKHTGPLITPGDGTPAITDPRILRLLSRIDAQPAFDWRVSQLARDVDMTPGHLHALATRTLGKGIKQHIIDARLRLAVRLLRPNTTGAVRSIKQVSRLAGFSSQHYFARLFKQRYKLTPRAFQQSAGEI